MQKNTPLWAYSLRYLYNEPKTIKWKVITPEGAKLSVLQDHDLIFDDYDLKIRKIII